MQQPFVKQSIYHCVLPRRMEIVWYFVARLQLADTVKIKEFYTASLLAAGEQGQLEAAGQVAPGVMAVAGMKGGGAGLPSNTDHHQDPAWRRHIACNQVETDDHKRYQQYLDGSSNVDVYNEAE